VKKRTLDYVPIVVVGAVLTTLVVLAVFLVNRESSGAVAADAEVAILAESTLSAAAGAVNATNFAVVLSVDITDPELIAEARAGAEEAFVELNTRSARLVAHLPPNQRSRLVDALRLFTLATEDALAALVSLDEQQGSTLLAAQAGTYRTMVEMLAEVRDTRTADILVAGEGVGRAADAVRFLVVFLLPMGIMIAVWRAIRRSAKQRILTEELRHARDESRSKDQFIADVSHELRTPLTGIYGFASSLEDASDDMPEPARELVGFIVTESAELSRMIDDLVAAGRIDADAISYELEPVPVLDEIREVVRPFRRRGISVEVDDISIVVLADRMRLSQILRNLVSNAAKHGGSEIAVTAYTRDDTAVIEVIDDGAGVAEDVKGRLFDRYVHKDGSAVVTGSVGLGLAIARSFAQGMGGSLGYERVEELTIFELRLPLAPSEKPTYPEPELSAVSL
jgi:signal transduction histidine kinase